MIYRSNLTCPDLTPHFNHLVSRPMGHSFGHDVPSDWGDKANDDPVFGLYKRCGMWTHDEAAILYNVARSLPPGDWLDIGCHTGWTTRHIAAAHPFDGFDLDGSARSAKALESNYVHWVDPMLSVPGFSERFAENGGETMKHPGEPLCGTSQEIFARGPWFYFPGNRYRGVVIDGDHEPGKPLEDAQNSAAHLAADGVILLHDFIGQPVREAVTWLLDHGFHARIYWTPHMVACCWRGDFQPPDHVPDPRIVAEDLPARMPDFDFSRCE